MYPTQWPWTWEEEKEWERELHREELGWMEELVDHIVRDGMAGSGYDPLQPQDEVSDDEVVVP
jgi:hypothetical protein